ncbi:hypothetical protein CDL12_02898 [Handroanthus impetiginosus]|uniref:PB1-like domain-containing protein n=1 Tax=Handroanthus impetiginosus TaxID=429701 RepID=A0A2G9I3M0_9LAMI|nr:hypothetical protein CDL12_02898 [Handroanthus impetiginosus]
MSDNGDYANIQMWVGGHFEHSPVVKYVGGVYYYYEDIDLDKFWFDDLYKLYERCGGQKTNVNFYYNRPGYPLDMGLRLINRLIDVAIGEMVEAYRGTELPISIYVEELDDPLVSMDEDGNLLPNRMTVEKRNEESMQLVPYGQDKMSTLLHGINFDDEFEEMATQQFTQSDSDLLGSSATFEKPQDRANVDRKSARKQRMRKENITTKNLPIFLLQFSGYWSYIWCSF